MNFLETIGIDVSKPFIDAFIHTSKKHKRFENSEIGFKTLLNWIQKYSIVNDDNILFVFEYTGLYSLPLTVFFSENDLNYVIIPGLELKRSLGIARGKDDRIDAKQIALYAYRRREELIPHKMPSKNLLKIRKLLSLRSKIIRQRTGFKTTNTEIPNFLKKEEHALYFQIHSEMIEKLDSQIKRIDDELDLIIKDDEYLNNIYKLILSVKGIGAQTAIFLIAYTNAFTLFKNAKKFASYSGIAPFPYQSGISLKGKSKVHNFANKKIKSLLSNCASSAIIHNPEMKIYFKRRLEEGKNKMSTINIIRNKLLSRVFAAVQRGTPYVNTVSYIS